MNGYLELIPNRLSVHPDTASVVDQLPARAGPRHQGDRLRRPGRAEGRLGGRGRRDLGPGHESEVHPHAQGHARGTGMAGAPLRHFLLRILVLISVVSTD